MLSQVLNIHDIMMFSRGGCNEKRLFSYLKKKKSYSRAFTLYEASVNTTCTYTFTVASCAYRHVSIRMGLKEFIFLSVSIAFTCAVSKFMFPSSEYCDSVADHS